MAQTVAVQAGGIAHAWTNTNTSTLFTQSGGTSTRVIINQLQFYCVDGGTPATVGIYLQSAASGTMSMIGGVKFIYQSMYTFQAWGGGSQPIDTAYGNSGTGPYGVPSGYVVGSGSSGGTVGSIGASGVNIYTPYNYQEFVYFPSSFYMANGDSVKLRGNWSGNSGNCYYSFTTITES